MALAFFMLNGVFTFYSRDFAYAASAINFASYLAEAADFA